MLFLVLNYDDLLEQALYQFTAGVIRFESLDDYVRTDQPAKIIKLHGSINWFKSIGPQNGDWATYVRTSDVLAKPPDNEVHVAARDGKSNQTRTYQVEISGQRVYPVLTAPLAGKGTTAMVCPEKHLATASEFLNDCSRFLIIGASGLDDDLLDLLSNAVRGRSPWLQFVSGSDAEGKEVWQRFASGVGAFASGAKSAGELVFDGGFRKYVATNEIIEFLRA